MPLEISVPFRLGPDNKIASESNPDAQIRQHVMSLVNTEPGERVVLGDYGVAISSLVFETDDVKVARDLSTDIEDMLATYEPGVALQGVTPSATSGEAGDGIASVDVHYMRTDAPSTSSAASRSQNVAVISSGGKVSEVIRG
jgi:phage baseplate assembly protein W